MHGDFEMLCSIGKWCCILVCI